ncbi:E3 ubiquitin-protein ligase TRIM39 [Pimephales promelas]|nr:E3 ubiquitin-protein ligase TRIM39 [Pimephales promelas]
MKNKLQDLQSYSEAELAELEQLLSNVTHSVHRLRAELVGGVEQRREAVIGRGQSVVSRLEEALEELQERRARLEAQAVSHDHIGFLQSFEDAQGPLSAAPDPPEEDLSLSFSLGDVKAALGEIRERLDHICLGEVRYTRSVPRLTESESMVSVRSLRKKDWSLKDLRKLKLGHKKVKGYLEDVTLNPMSAYPFLILSEDRKQLKRGEKLQFYRNNSQRFDVWSCVLAKHGYESGRHYWEVSVGENRDWKLGVMCESAQRKGLFDMTPASGYYALWWSGSHLRALTVPPLAKVRVTGHLRRVGVYLDLEEGQMIFYNAKSGSELHSFTAQFPEKMFPLFGTADKDVPLVLKSVVPSVPDRAEPATHFSPAEPATHVSPDVPVLHVSPASESPVQVRDESPVQVRDESPVQVSESSVQVSAESPVQVSAESPVQVSAESPVQVSAESPVQVSAESPVQVSAESPVQVSAESPVQVSAESPVQVSAESPVQVSAESPVQVSELSSPASVSSPVTHRRRRRRRRTRSVRQAPVSVPRLLALPAPPLRLVLPAPPLHLALPVPFKLCSSCVLQIPVDFPNRYPVRAMEAMQTWTSSLPAPPWPLPRPAPPWPLPRPDPPWPRPAPPWPWPRPAPPWPPPLPAPPWPPPRPAPPWSPAQSGMLTLCGPGPPWLPPGPVPLHGPGPPSLPQDCLHFTALLNFLLFVWASGAAHRGEAMS